MYRLVIDVEVGTDREEAKKAAEFLLNEIRNSAALHKEIWAETSYRLQLDSDRNKKNHLLEDSNGHVGTAKGKL